MNTALRLFVSVLPEWQRIEMLREAVSRLVAAVLDEARADTIAMVSCELLENAIKYGRSGADVISISIERRPSQVVISVENAVEEGSGHVDALKEQLAWLHSFQNPAEAYMAALGRVFERALSAPDEGRLGLARVAFEGGCAISWGIDQPGRLVVHAVHALDPAPLESAA